MTGNCDHPEVNLLLEKHDPDLEGRRRNFRGLLITGLNGSLPCPGMIPNERNEHDYQPALKTCHAQEAAYGAGWILVSHQPPLDTTCDRIGRTRIVRPGPFKSGHDADIALVVAGGMTEIGKINLHQ